MVFIASTCDVSLCSLLHGLVTSHCGLHWNEISDKLAKQGAVKNMSEISSNNLLLSSHLMRLIHCLRRLYINKLKKVNLRYLLVLDI